MLTHPEFVSRGKVQFTAFLLCLFALLLPNAGVAKMDVNIEGVPLPADVSPASEQTSPFSGTWIGMWDGTLKTALVVEDVTENGDAKVVYAVADHPQGRFERQWFRYDAKIDGTILTVFGRRLPVTFELSETGRLKAILGDGYAFGILTRHDITTLTQSDAEIVWSVGTSEFLETDLSENGERVRLEAVIFRPPGEGPFPLAVVNHGSTGSGDGSVPFTDTWTNPWFAEILNELGWLVAFPQRRGRGQSDGLYDEGFAVDRSEGYTCETKRSLAGADRALEDLRAAIDALRRHDNVKDEPILLAGNSRGGILSVAYAGLHAQQTRAVINFVGGWIGEGCDTADTINQALFKKGARFPQPTLWLYGKDDYFYSMEHSRNNFEAFREAGGKGEFIEATVAGDNNGHWVMSIPPLWETHVLKYLNSSAE